MGQTVQDRTRTSPATGSSHGSSAASLANIQLLPSIADRPYEAQVAALTPPCPVSCVPAMSASPAVDSPVQASVGSSTSAFATASTGVAPVQCEDGPTGQPTVSVPKTYEEWAAHMRTTFATELAELQTLYQQFKATGGEARAAEQTLEGKEQVLVELKTKYQETNGNLSKKEKAMLDQQTAIKPYRGQTMAELYEQAKDLLEKHKNTKIEDETDRATLEALMNAAMELSSEIDPEGFGKGRTLYMQKIDIQENGRLIALADEGGMPPAECATLAVNYRTWARIFVREEIMKDETAVEILYLRDLGISGNRTGETPETIMSKVWTKMKEEKGIDPEITFDEATEEQKLEVYRGMIKKAKETNVRVNTAA